MTQIKRNIVLILSDENDLASKGMSNARFVEHIWVTACAVTDHDPRSIDQRDDVLNDCRVLPDIIRSPASQASIVSGLADAVVNGSETRVEGHHRRSEHRLDILMLRDLKDARALTSRTHVSQEKAIKIYILDRPMIPRKL